MDVDEAEEESSESDLFEVRFSGLEGIIREGEEAELHVAVSAVNNIDTGDVATQLEVGIDATGIRAVDAEGISETYDGGYNGNGSGDLETFTVGAADTGTLTVREGDDNPEAGLVLVDDTTDTEDVVILEFELEADDQDISIEDLPVSIQTSGITGGVGSAIIRAHLMQGDEVIKTESVAGTGTSVIVVFDNVDIEIANGDTEVFSVAIDVQDTDSGEPDSGDSVTASTTAAAAGWDVEDENGENVTPTGNAAGNAQEFNANAIVATFNEDDSTEVRTNGSIANDPDQVDFTLKFNVANNGDDDIYIDGDVEQGSSTPGFSGFHWATTTDSTSMASTSFTGIFSPDDGYDSSDDTNNSGDKRLLIRAGDDRDFTFKVTIPTSGDNQAVGVRVTGITWGTTNADDMDNLYDFDLGGFTSDTITGLMIR